VRLRLCISVLGLVLLGVGLAACGGSSSTSTSTSSTTSSTTTTTTAATTSTSGATGGTTSSACTGAIQVAQSLGQQIQAAGGNNQAIVQAVRSVIPQLQSAANQATGNAKTALNNLVRSLQSLGNGATGPAVANQIANAAQQLAGACS
jgi:hypothetical protein